MKILIVEVNWLGDVLFSTPAIKALRKKFPQSSISCLILPRVKDVLEGNPDINELIVNDEEALHKGFWGKMRLANELKKKKFDMAVLFHRSFTRAMLVYLAGISRRVGYSTWKRRFLLSDPIPMPPKDSQHRVDYYLGIVKPLAIAPPLAGWPVGCLAEDRHYEFFTSAGDDKFIEKIFLEEGIIEEDFIVCLNPGGNWGPKRWPKENFSRLADSLIDEYKAKVIFSGSEDDVSLIKEIARLMKHTPIITAGKTNLKQSACLFKKAGLVISADSGPLHIAAAVGANVIALFGPTLPAITGPLGRGKIKVIRRDISGSTPLTINPERSRRIDCALPCYAKNCDNNTCMQEITVQDVMSEIKNSLAERK